MSNYGFCLKRPVKQQLHTERERECVFAVRAPALAGVFRRNCVSFQSGEIQTGGERERDRRGKVLAAVGRTVG